MNRLKSTLRTLIIALCMSVSLSTATTARTKPETWLTVFVHGIKSVKPHISINNFIRFMTDDTENTVYSKTVELMRKDPTFYLNQPMLGVGLIKIDTNRIEKGYAAGAVAHGFEAMSQFVNPDKNINNHYYTFGWSGLMSEKQRYLEGLNLYKSIELEITKFRLMGIEPKVRIIAYSHGGNVALNVAQARKTEKLPDTFDVQELVLLGVPIQNETDFLVNEPIFKKIYHIYSRGDRIQKLDFFSFKRFFSRRVFKKRKGFQLPDKLIQIQLKCTRTVKFKRKNKKKMKLLTYKLKNKGVVSGKSRNLFRDASPGHTELWFFGWTPVHYRERFPLNPLPASTLIPMIIREAENFEEKGWFNKPTLIDIRPQQEVVIVKNQKSRGVLRIARFLPKADFENLKETVLQFKPENLTKEIYNGRITTAYNRSKQIHRKQRKLRKRYRQRRRMQQKLAKLA